MFALDSNIIPHFERICSVDQGTDINPMVHAALTIVRNAMDARQDPTQGFEFTTDAELRLLNGFQIATNTYAPDFELYAACDLHSYRFTRQGAEWMIDWLADKTKRYFWYAQAIIAEQQPAKKRSRRRKTI